MAFMKICCFCFDTKSGSIASGFYTLITKILAITVVTLLLHYNQILKQEATNAGVNAVEYKALRGLLIFSLVKCIIFLIFGCLLIYGAWNDRASYLIPWIVATCFGVAFDIIMLISTITVVAFLQKELVGMVFLIIYIAYDIAIEIYMIICVETQRELLTKTCRSSKCHADI